MKADVKETNLYVWLENKNSVFLSQVDKMIALAEDMLPIVKKTFINYTDHGIKHSVHVMEYMYALVKNVDELSDLEVVLLIESALFHDIGMVVNDVEIGNIKNRENIGEERKYSKVYERYQDETIALQECIRPIHGKRSQEYIESNIDIADFVIPGSTVVNFQKELGLICRAHNEDFEWLERNIEDKYEKGDYELNAQYIAVLLRIADYLDLDDQRAPLNVYNYLGLGEYSIKEWKKHFAVENYDKVKINEQTGMKEIVFSGDCSDPEIYRKLLEYFDDINDELHKAICWGKRMADQKYYLNICPIVDNKIRTNGFTISNLKLSMDFKAIMKLLMGENIYGSKKYGLRELIQNAIDACKVMQECALQLEEYRYERYQPEIYIVVDYDKQQLIIKDNGIGMSSTVLNKYFLSIGKSYYKSDDFKYQDLQYMPIGNFGIGFLSCFMLSSHVIVETRSYKEKEGLMLELRSDNEYICQRQSKNFQNSFGTMVYLSLEEVLDVFGDTEGIIDFVTRTFLDSTIDFYFKEIAEENEKKRIIKLDLQSFEEMAKGKIVLNDYLKNIECAMEIDRRVEAKEMLSQVDFRYMKDDFKIYIYDDKSKRLTYSADLNYKEIKKYQMNNEIVLYKIRGIPHEKKNEYKRWEISRRATGTIFSYSEELPYNWMQEKVILVGYADEKILYLRNTEELPSTYYGIEWKALYDMAIQENDFYITTDLKSIVQQCDFVEKTIYIEDELIEFQDVGEDRFLQIERGEAWWHNDEDDSNRVYWKGIALPGERVYIPVDIKGVVLGNYIINITDKAIIPNISRNSLQQEDRQRIVKQINQAIYKCLIDCEEDRDIKIAIESYMKTAKLIDTNLEKEGV